MVEHNMLRTRSKTGRHQVRRVHRKAPGSREFSAEEHCAVQLHSAQDLGDRIHFVFWSAGWTICKVSWPPSGAIRPRKPFEQVMAPLGHGFISRRTAQL